MKTGKIQLAQVSRIIHVLQNHVDVLTRADAWKQK